MPGGGIESGMGVQLPLPGSNVPTDQLRRLARDKLEAKAEIRAALDRLAFRQGASLRDIDHAMERYADSMIADAIYEVESELQREIENQDPL